MGLEDIFLKWKVIFFNVITKFEREGVLKSGNTWNLKTNTPFPRTKGDLKSGVTAFRKEAELLIQSVSGRFGDGGFWKW